MNEMHSCLCCLRCPPDKDLTTPFKHHDRIEIYTDMLKDCFNIQMELDEWGSCGICSLCAGRLRDASDFKLQVQRCQAELRARSQPKTSVKGSVKPEPEWFEEASCVKQEPSYSETTGEVSGGSEAAVLAGVSEAAMLAGVSEAAMLAGLYDDHVFKDELVLGPERPHRPCVGSTLQGSIKAEPEWCEEASCVKQEPLYSETTGELSGGSEAAVLTGVNEAAMPAGVSEAAMLAGVSEAAMLAGLYEDHVFKDELVLGPERPHRPRVGSTLQEESPVKQEPATVEETELLDSERPVKSEVPDGAARAEDGPAREYCENEYIMQSSVLLRAESPVSLRARSQLAAACAVRLERLRGTRTYCCDMCTQLFNDKSTLIRHIRTHYRCQLCNKTFMMNSCLSRHEPTCNENKQKKPKLTETSTLTRSHCEEVLYTCDECGEGFKVKFVLRKHIQRIHITKDLFNNRHSLYKKPKSHTLMSSANIKPYHCCQCEYKTSVRSNLQRHRMIHTEEKPFKCGYCDYACKSKSNLRLHQRIHTGEKPYKCGYCDYKFRVKSSLLRHQRIHTGEKPFQCDYCDYKCTRNSILQGHQSIHIGEKPFQCGDCDYKFRVKSDLLRHQRIHTGEKPFKCSYCEYRCNKKSGLLRHQRKHTGEKPFQCGYCDCKFRVNSDLLRHQRIHTGEKPFKCGYCEYRCNQKSYLLSHQRIHTGEKPFKCGYCDYRSRVKSDLQRHQKIHTG